MTTTIQLTDTERDQFVATGHIVDGESCESIDAAGLCTAGSTATCCNGAMTLSAKWRPATESCPTCDGKGTIFKPPYVGADPSLCYAQANIHPGDTGPVYCDRLAGHSLVHEGDDFDAPPLHRRVLWKDGFQPSAHRPCPNPDCVGGKPVVTLTVTCDEPGNHDYHKCFVVPGGNGILRQALGRFTIQALPVVDQDYGAVGYVWPAYDCVFVDRSDPADEHAFIATVADGMTQSIRLDPLPQPGQFVLRPERVE